MHHFKSSWVHLWKLLINTLIWVSGMRFLQGRVNLTLSWNCFFELLFIAFVIIIIYIGLPQKTLSVCLTIKPKCLCLGPYPTVDGYTKEKINTSPPQGLLFQEIFVRLMAFCIYLLTALPLCSMKEPGIQTPVRWLFWDISLPSSLSVGFL